MTGKMWTIGRHLSGHSPIGTEENHENLSEDSLCLG